MGQGNLGKTNGFCQFSDPQFVLRTDPGVHQDHGNGVNAAVVDPFQCSTEALSVERFQLFSGCRVSTADFNDFAVQHFRPFDSESKDVRPVLVTDPQAIAKATSDYQNCWFSISLQ